MSKFDEVVKLLNEYDVRSTGQGIPSVPGDGYTSTSDPNTIGNAAQFAPDRRRKTLPFKPFADELNHKDNGTILPYPLDHTYERLANIKINIVELRNILRAAYEAASLTKPQKHILEKHNEVLEKQLEYIDKFVKDLDLLAVPY